MGFRVIASQKSYFISTQFAFYAHVGRNRNAQQADTTSARHTVGPTETLSHHYTRRELDRWKRNCVVSNELAPDPSVEVTQVNQVSVCACTISFVVSRFIALELCALCYDVDPFCGGSYVHAVTCHLRMCAAYLLPPQLISFVLLLGLYMKMYYLRAVLLIVLAIKINKIALELFDSCFNTIM